MYYMSRRARSFMRCMNVVQALLASGSRPPDYRSQDELVPGVPPLPQLCYNKHMTDPPNHLKLVDPSANPLGIDAEFIPLPYYPWDHRPSHLPVDIEEAATALYLCEGLIGKAAERLKIEPLRLVRIISRSARLTRLHQELAALLNDKVHEEYIRAFAGDDDRRREWASSKVSQTKQFQSHPLAPNTNVAPTLAGVAGPTRIIISWEDPLTIEHQPSDE